MKKRCADGALDALTAARVSKTACAVYTQRNVVFSDMQSRWAGGMMTKRSVIERNNRRATCGSATESQQPREQPKNAKIISPLIGQPRAAANGRTYCKKDHNNPCPTPPSN